MRFKDTHQQPASVSACGKWAVSACFWILSWAVLQGGVIMEAVAKESSPLRLATEEAYPQGELPDGLMFEKLFLEKKNRKLTAYAAGKPVRVYLVSLGFEPVGHKEVQGDGKTPEGKYHIDGKNPHSAYYKNLGISYPDDKARKNAQKLGKSPGGDIKIHGLAPSFAEIGEAHLLTDWTHGCIALTNPEMEELYTRTAVGTPIEIVP